MLTDAQLLELAGKATFARGRAYCAEGRVELTEYSADSLAGEAEGTRVYAFWLKREGDDWRWNCACPAADDGSFCKHLVAAVLSARDGDVPAEARPDDLADFLAAQPVARLAGWLRALAAEDRGVERRLLMHRAMQQPEALKAALAKSLGRSGFLDYRGSIRYAADLGNVVTALRARLIEDPAHCRELCEYALRRLFTIYARSDDSAGAIGDRLHEVAQLHARACAAAAPGKALVKSLFALQHKDEWGMLPLAAYWDALGGAGHEAYGRLIADELETLPPQPRDEDRNGETFAVRKRTEDYARASGDFALLQRVLRWDLRHAYDYLRVLQSLREFNREREALAFAEDAVKRFPGDDRLRDALAACLQAAGLGDEALQQRWQVFCLRPDADHWDSLRQAAGRDWPQWRQRALEDIATREGATASLRITLLMHDGDLDTALTLARSQHPGPHVLRALAQCLEADAPAAAGELYLRIVDHWSLALHQSSYRDVVACLQRARRLAAPELWRPALAALRLAHARKTKLMAMLGDAGL